MQSIFEFPNYNGYLDSVLKSRQKRNPRYSLRAMAKSLDMAPASLSEILATKKNLSSEKAHDIASRLELPVREARYFCTLALFQSAKNEELRAQLAAQLQIMNPRLREHFEPELDIFNFISEWYHTAILEMTYLNNFSLIPKNVARRLGIEIGQAHEALDLLERLELIQVVKPGHYEKIQRQLLFQSDLPNLALRKYHRSMLDFAKTSLETQLPTEKSIGSETFPFDVTDLPEAKAIIEECFQQILQLSERCQNKTEVYHLGIQFFRLTVKE